MKNATIQLVFLCSSLAIGCATPTQGTRPAVLQCPAVAAFSIDPRESETSKARAIERLQQAKQRKLWTLEDRNVLRQALGQMTDCDREEVIHEVLSAVNQGELLPDRNPKDGSLQVTSPL